LREDFGEKYLLGVSCGRAIRYKSAFNSKSGLPAEVISTQAGFLLLSLTQKKYCHTSASSVQASAQRHEEKMYRHRGTEAL
jgi:hypothetical protein